MRSMAGLAHLALALLVLPVVSASASDCERDASEMMQLRWFTTTTPDPEGLPPYAVKLTSKGGRIGAMVFDDSTKWDKACTEAALFLQNQQLINLTDAGQNYNLCNGSTWTWCFQIKESGAVKFVQQPRDIEESPVPRNGAELEARFEYEKNMDPDLAEYTRSLGLKPEEAQRFAKNLEGAGVYKKSQLVNQKSATLFEGLTPGPLAQRKIADAQDPDPSQSQSGGGMVMTAAGEAAKVQAQAAAMKAQLEEARTQMQDAAKAGSAELANQAQAQLDNVLSQLNGISVGTANLSTAAQLDALNAAIASGGFVNGHTLDTRQLIAFNGAFRGIDLMTTFLPSLKSQAVSLKPWYAQMSDDKLALNCQLRPEMDSEEFYIESQQASDLQVANGMVDTFGSSAFHASVSGWQGALDITSSCFGGGASGGQSKSSSGGQAKKDENSQSKNLQKSITTLAKTQYFLQPKLLLYISQDMLQMSDTFTTRCHQASYVLCQTQGRKNCSKWLDTSPSAPTTSNPSSESTLVISCIVTNVQVMKVLRQPKYLADITTALTSTASSVAGANDSNIDVALFMPGRAFAPGGDIFNNLQVSITIRQATFQMYGSLQVSHARGFLEPAILQGFSSAPFIDQVVVPNKTNTLANFFLKYNPLEGSAAQLTGFDAFEAPKPGQTAEQVVPALMYDFGSHVCPHVTMGGSWRVTANYASTVSQEKLEVERATSDAMMKARAEAWGANINGAASKNGAAGGVAGGTSHSSGNQKNSGDSSGSKDVQLVAMKNATMTVEQTWKGGAPGVSAADWRRSLDSSMSSNWKVIQRDLTRCIGLWSFMDDPFLADAMCSLWVQLFMEAQNVTAGNNYTNGREDGVPGQVPPEIMRAACSTTQNMQYLIEYAQNSSQWQQKLAEDACKDQHPGHHWAPPDQCLMNQCFCTVEGQSLKGTSSKDCPENGKTDCAGCCTLEQRVFCNANACATGFVLKANAAKYQCQLATCEPANDNSQCCMPADVARNFRLTFQVSPEEHCGTDSNIQALLKYHGGEGPTVLLSSSGNDFEAGQQETFSYAFPDAEHPTQICVYNEGDDELCLDWVKIANSDGPTPLHLGITNNWPPLSKDEDDQKEDGAVYGTCIDISYDYV